MNKINYILITLLLGGSVSLNAQTSKAASEMQLADTLSIGYQMNVSSRTSSYSINGVNASAFEKSPYIDISKALYGKVAGLNVYQGTGSSADNVSTLSIHGNAPLVLIDGFPRDISDITSMEIESCYVLKDAAAAALYGMRGANGVVLITTKRGISNGLKVNVDYNFGVNTQFRSPDFADAYTYANSLNTALSGDGLPARYNAQELNAFRTGIYPYDYPNVDWWNETLNDTGFTHNLKMSFSGGSDKFRFYTVVDYYRDRSMLKKNTEDTRFDTTPTDTRLTVRTNLDVKVTESTLLKAGIVGRLKEFRGTRYGRSAIFNKIYGIPSAAFPIRYENGIYGGSSVYGTGNPVALLKDYGHIRNVYGTLLADLSIRQDLSALTKGLAAEASVSFDNIGGMNETTNKEYRYMNSNASITSDGTLVTTPAIYGTDSETLGHTQPFERLMLRSDFQAKVDYNRTFGKHQVGGALIYDMQSVVKNGRNNSQKNQSVLVNATYTYDNRYSLNAVFNRSGSA
ncbi:TonB-dependent receptor plug domain-containing protein, partial [Bacteroides thetaiotaomicron]